MNINHRVSILIIALFPHHRKHLFDGVVVVSHYIPLVPLGG